MINFEQNTAPEITRGIAKCLRAVRKRRRITQGKLSFGSIKRFENTGDISLKSLALIAIALKTDNELTELFTEVPFNSIE